MKSKQENSFSIYSNQDKSLDYYPSQNYSKLNKHTESSAAKSLSKDSQLDCKNIEEQKEDNWDEQQADSKSCTQSSAIKEE